MQEIRELIKEWIESWKECRFCENMVKNNYSKLCGEHKVICDDCSEKQYEIHLGKNENTLRE